MRSSSGIMGKLAIMYLIAWCVSPPLSYGTIYRIAALGAMGIIVLKYIKENGFWVDKNYVIFGLIVVYIVVVSIYTGEPVTNRLAVIILFGLMFCSEIFSSNARVAKEYFFIVPLTFLLCIVWNICSLRGIAETPNVMRLLVKNSDISIQYAKQGIGGFGYLYTVVLLLPIAIDCMLNRRMKRVYRLVAFAFVYTTYALVFQAQYFFAIIISLFLIGIYFIAKIKDIAIKTLMLIILSGFFIWIYSNAETVLLYLMDTVKTRAIDLKIQSIYDIFITGESVENSEFSARFESYIKSFDYALTHPVLGGLRYSVTGTHSHIIDFLAQYGFVFGSIYLNVIYEPIKRFQVKKFETGYTCAVIFGVMLLLNTLVFSFGIIMYFILPLYYYQTEVS